MTGARPGAAEVEPAEVDGAPPWPPGTATAIGSLPGTDPREAARTVVGELPDLPHLPELPARGVGADLVGRSAGLLVDLAVEVVPSAYRITARPGRDHRRAVDQLRADVDALDEAVESTGARPAAIKVQAAGPWTLAAEVELRTGHRMLTDRGAVRDLAASLAEGVARHAADVARRTGARVVVQLDEPQLPAVLAGSLPTPSGYGTVAAVAEPDAVDLLRSVLDGLPRPVVVHCCAPRPPVALLRRAGADALALDAGLLGGAPRATVDALGEAWDDGAVVLLGLVPSLDPPVPPRLTDLARPALQLVDRLGFPRALLAQRCVPTPACGLAGASAAWSRRAMALCRDLGRAFVEPPEAW